MFNFQGPSERVGHNNAEGPPVPIPNTEVKLCGAEDTIPATVREKRTGPTREEKNLSEKQEDGEAVGPLVTGV